MRNSGFRGISPIEVYIQQLEVSRGSAPQRITISCSLEGSGAMKDISKKNCMKNISLVEDSHAVVVYRGRIMA